MIKFKICFSIPIFIHTLLFWEAFENGFELKDDLIVSFKVWATPSEKLTEQEQKEVNTAMKSDAARILRKLLICFQNKLKSKIVKF